MDRIGALARVHWRLGIALLLTGLSFLVCPLYMIHLRHQLAQGLPEEWDRVTNNGPFTYVSPLLVTARNIEEGEYATRVVQILRSGFPYEPHTGDHSLRAWLFDSMSFYPLVPFAWISGRDVQRGWILAHATLGALWVLFLYVVFWLVGADAEYALLFAVGGFFFMDFFNWGIAEVIPGLYTFSRSLGNILFLWVTRPVSPIQFMRLPTPGMTYLWTFAAMACAYRLAFYSKRREFFSLLIGFSLGLLSLSHFYEWTFGVGSVFLLLSAGLLGGMPAEGRRNLIVVNAVSISTSIAYYAVAQHMTGAIMADIIARMGAKGRFFHVGSLVNLGLAGFFWRLSRIRDRMRWFFVFEALQEVCVFAGTNASWLLGYDMQFVHFCLLGACTGSVGLLAWLYGRQGLRKALRPHAVVLVAAILAMVLLREKGWADTHFKIFGTPRDVEAAAEWMDQNVPRNSMLLCLTGVLNEFLPLKIQMRYPVFNGALSYGPPRPTQDNIDGFARLLKTLQVDPARFMDERLDRHWEVDARKQEISYLTRNVAWAEAQKASWSYFLFALECGYFREDGLDRRIIKAYEVERPLSPPYYLWLQKGDEGFLSRTPESLGGVLIYSNPSVRLYEFKKSSA